MATSGNESYEEQKKSLKPKSTKNAAEDVIGKSTVGLSTGDIKRKIDLLEETQNTVSSDPRYKITQKDINKKRLKDYGIKSDRDLSEILPIAATDYDIKEEEDTSTKIEVIEPTERKHYLGEKIIGINPFDNYFLFNIYNEIDGNDVPLDLSSAGTLYLSFGSEKEEVRVPNYTNTEDADISKGQVIFRVSKNDSRKVLGFDNNNFYITASMQMGNNVSDETVLYFGKFYPYHELYENTLRAEYEEYMERTNLHINLLEEKIHDLERDLDSYKKDNDKLFQLNRDLENKNEELTDILERIKKKLTESDKREVENAEKKSIKLVEKNKEEIKKKLNVKSYNKIVPSPEPKTIKTTKTKDLGSTGTKTTKKTEKEILTQVKRQKVKTTQTNYNTNLSKQVNTDK